MLMVPGELPPVASAPYVHVLLVVVEDMVGVGGLHPHASIVINWVILVLNVRNLPIWEVICVLLSLNFQIEKMVMGLR